MISTRHYLRLTINAIRLVKRQHCLLYILRNTGALYHDDAGDRNKGQSVGRFATGSNALKVTADSSSKFKNLKKRLEDSVQSVASTLPGDAAKNRAELSAKLEEQLSKAEDGTEARDATRSMKLMEGMKTEGKDSEIDVNFQFSRASHIAEQVRRFPRPPTEDDGDKVQRGRMYPSRTRERARAPLNKNPIGLFSGTPLGIFDPQKLANLPTQDSQMPLWEELDKERLERLTKLSPRNGFEEMIKWTEEGKLLPYPVDNELGWDELNIGFHEHVFLEQELDKGFPREGPIRQFMELVITGLSKNPYMTVAKKMAHISWFRDYFKEKQAEIDRLHALESAESGQTVDKSV